jgi:hypothetical protein
MKSPRLLLAVSLFSCLAGCGRTRIVCKPGDPAAAGAVLRASVPAVTVHQRIEAQMKEGLIRNTAEGDLFFVPPDTIRMELRALWGEAVFDLRGAGDSLCYQAGGDNVVRCGKNSMPWLPGWDPIEVLAGLPGVYTFVDSAGAKVECGDRGLVFSSAACRVTLDPDGRFVRRVDAATGGSFLEITAYEKTAYGWFPREIRWSDGRRTRVDITVKRRVFARPLSGASLLK